MSKVASEGHDAVAIVVEALGVLQTRDGFDIPPAVIEERARNIVTALAGVPKGRPNPIVSMVTEYLDVRRQAQEVLGQLDDMAVTDAATAVAALLADPFDRDARTEARTWLRAWTATHSARSSTSTTPGAAVRS